MAHGTCESIICESVNPVFKSLIQIERRDIGTSLMTAILYSEDTAGCDADCRPL